MTEISVTRALAEVKSLNDRIARAVSQPFISFTTGDKHASGTPVIELERQYRSNLQSVRDMINRRASLKSAIVVSNAQTKVTVAGIETTVAEAIERKSSIQLDKLLLAQLITQRGQVQAQVERTNAQVATRLDQLIQTTVGKDRQVTEAEISAISVPFEKANKAANLDPNDVAKVYEKLQEEISAFELEVDFALSEVNAVTKITV